MYQFRNQCIKVFRWFIIQGSLQRKVLQNNLAGIRVALFWKPDVQTQTKHYTVFTDRSFILWTKHICLKASVNFRNTFLFYIFTGIQTSVQSIGAFWSYQKNYQKGMAFNIINFRVWHVVTFKICRMSVSNLSSLTAFFLWIVVNIEVTDWLNRLQKKTKLPWNIAIYLLKSVY